MKIFGIIAALAITFGATQQAQAVPTSYDFSGDFSWQASSVALPVQASVSFSGTAILDDGVDALDAASFDIFGTLDINGTIFNLSNVGIRVTDSLSELKIVIGDANPNQILGNTNDFSVEFVTSGPIDFSSPPDTLEIDVRDIFIANAGRGLNGIYSPDITGGSIRFDKVVSNPGGPTAVPAPAAAPVLLTGLVGLGFINRRRRQHSE